MPSEQQHPPVGPHSARVWARRLVVVGVLGAQAFALLHGRSDPHKVYAFQMFAEASRWKADIVRVTHDGRRVPISEPWPGGYTWNELVRGRSLNNPSRLHHADASLAGTLDFLQEALHWVADHTPLDEETAYLEAEVTTSYNRRPLTTVIMRSRRR